MSVSPRLSFDALPADLRTLLTAWIERHGGLGELLARAAHQPDVLTGWLAWMDELERVLPFRMGMAAALSVAAHTGSEYQRIEHERRALAGGMTPEEIDAIESGVLSRVTTLSEAEGAAAALARCVVDTLGCGCEPAFLRLARLVGEPTAVACLMIVACAIGQATMANAWALAPAAPKRSGERRFRSSLNIL